VKQAAFRRDCYADVVVARRGFEIGREQLPSGLREAIVSAMAKVGYRLAESPQAQEPYRAPASSTLSLRFEPDARLRPRAFGRVHVWRGDDRTLRVEPTFAWLGVHSVGWGPTSVLCSLALPAYADACKGVPIGGSSDAGGQ
jgi:hypothetical protein